MAAPPRKKYLQRLIMGLDQSIEDQRGMLAYYAKGNIEGMYTEKFIVSMEEQLLKAKAELLELLRKEKAG